MPISHVQSGVYPPHEQQEHEHRDRERVLDAVVQHGRQRQHEAREVDLLDQRAVPGERAPTASISDVWNHVHGKSPASSTSP